MSNIHRDIKITEMVLKGMTYKAVGQLFDITTERVRQIVAKIFRSLRMRLRRQDRMQELPRSGDIWVHRENKVFWLNELNEYKKWMDEK